MQPLLEDAPGYYLSYTYEKKDIEDISILFWKYDDKEPSSEMSSLLAIILLIAWSESHSIRNQSPSEEPMICPSMTTRSSV